MMFPPARQIFPVLVAALILWSQLLLPPIIGLADNADYVNVTGPLQLVPAAPAEGSERFFDFLIPLWKHDPNEPFGVRLYTSTLLPTALAFYTASPITGGLFDIRLAGLVHSLIFLAALYLIAPIIRNPAIWIAILAVLCDVVYFCYFNSFYSDAGSFLYLMLAAAFYARLAAGHSSAKWNATGLIASILLLLTSKLQHTFLLAPLLFLLIFDKRIAKAIPRKILAACAALFCIAVWGMYQRVPVDYRTMAAYHIVYSDLLIHAAEPHDVLRELGLPPDTMMFKGTDAFGPRSGMNHVTYRKVMLDRLSHAKLLGFYLRHPEAPTRLTEAALLESARERHFGHGNFAKSAGKPPASTSHAFAIVSDTRRLLFENRPGLYALYLLAVIFGLVYTTRASAASLAVAAMAAIEFFLSALADCKETDRHLFLFRAIVDLALVALIARLYQNKSWRS
ncbi:MAG: hypothetical protein JNK48_09030 [Bryobacterales bacterium]|nr:hypothetical protein [Bryobacterales bacterium]